MPHCPQGKVILGRANFYASLAVSKTDSCLNAWLDGEENIGKPAQMWVRVGHGAEERMTIQTEAASADKKYVLGAPGTS